MSISIVILVHLYRMC